MRKRKSPREGDVVVGFFSAKNVAAISYVWLVRSDDESHRSVRGWIGQGGIGCTVASFVAAGALSVHGYALDRQREIRDQFGVRHVHRDIPFGGYLRVVLTHRDGVLKWHQSSLRGARPDKK